MAWNEPGGNNRDPWGGGGRDQGPPDLDEVIRKLSGRFNSLFGKGSSGGRGGGRGGTVGLWLIALAVVGIWAASGIYIVDAGSRGVELRFGQVSDITEPGLNYHFPYPIESVEVVDVEQRRAEEIGYRTQPSVRSIPQEALMLTKDENIVDIRLSVQYQIRDPEQFLFVVRDPNDTLRQVVESSAREVVGSHIMDYILTEGRSDIVNNVLALSQDILDDYGTGLVITNVNLQDAQPPDEVQDAFADAIKAREDEQRLKNEAEAYANEVIPRARGRAARQLEEAEAYRDQVIARAEGETNRFLNLLSEYRKAPAVTGERLYIETMEDVLSRTNKVLVDLEGGNNLLYLPLDRMIRPRETTAGNNRGNPGSSLVGQTPITSSNQGNSGIPFRDTSRRREARQ